MLNKCKFHFLTSLICFFCISHVCGQQWYPATVPFNKNVNAAFIFNRNSVILAGGDTAYSTHDIFKSKDLGASWSIQIDQYQSWIKSISFHDTSTGYAVGDNGLVLKTTNGGNGWAYTNFPGNFTLNKIWCISDSTIFVFGGNTNIERVIFKSVDAGNTWILVDSAPGACLRSAFFINAQKGFAVGDSAIILMTTDSGNTWSRVTAPVARNFSSVTFINPDTGFIVGGIAADSIRSILRTTNAGLTWIVVKDELGNCFTDISFADGQNGFAVGDRASIFKSVNGGQTWLSSSANGSTSNDYFTCVKYFDPDFAVIGSQAGRTFVYTNTPMPVVDTVWTYYVDSVTYAVNALINTHGTPVICHCDFATNSNFSPTYTSYNQYITSDTFANVLIFLQGLTIHTNYYCRFVVQSILGSQYIDTLPLYTYTPHYFVETDTANNVTLSSAVLTGKLSNFFGPTYPLFNYSTHRNQVAGVTVHAIPNLVTDTLQHAVYAPISGLLPNVTYYYTLTVPSPYGNMAGDTLSFTTTQPSYTFETSNAIVTDTSALIYGVVENFPTDVRLVFDYGLTNAFGDTIVPTPALVNDTSYHLDSASLTSLVPFNTYFYRLRGETSNSTYFGSTRTFFMNPPSLNFHTLPATSITTVSAYLNGSIDQFPGYVQLFFEYGLTSSLGDTIVPVPAFVNDTAFHSVSVNLTGLQPYTTYFYRLRGKINNADIYSSIYQFFTDTNHFDIQTLAPAAIWATSATIEGFVHGVPGSAQLSFDYGLSPAFGDTVAASPSFVNDTSYHVSNAHLNLLLPDTNYYYRIKANINGLFYYGSTVLFRTDTGNFNLQTFPANITSTSSATLNGSVADFQVPVHLSFDYGTTQSLGQTIVAIPSVVNDSLIHNVSANLASLLTATRYYFRLRGETTIGTFLGNTLSFEIAPPYLFLQTTAAFNVTSSSAQLNGQIQSAVWPVTLSFDYGTDFLFSNSVSASPTTVTDTLLHLITTPLTGLAANSIYYYRLKAVTPQGVFLGDTLQIYTGSSEIPNWDFQYWDTSSIEIPDGWNMPNANFAKVPGRNGYALRINNPNFAARGAIADNMMPGQPIHFRPDSLSFYLDYNVETSDTAYALLNLTNGPDNVALNFFPISGNSGGTYKKLTYPISYSSSFTPDSVSLVFIPFNAFGNAEVIHPANYLAIDDIEFIPSIETVYNNNFETWFNYNREKPLSWYYPEFVFIDSTQPTRRFVNRVYYNPPYDYAVQLHSYRNNSYILKMDFQTIDKLFGSGPAGFPVSIRHESLNGYFKFYPDKGDSLKIAVDLFKQGQRIGNGEFYVGDTVSSFTPFEVPINYSTPGVIPDSATVSLAPFNDSHNPFGESWMVADKLRFDGFSVVTALPGIETGFVNRELKIYPNPACGEMKIEFENEKAGSVSYRIFDLSGKLIYNRCQSFVPPGKTIVPFDLIDMTTGVYLINVLSESDNLVSRFMIMR